VAVSLRPDSGGEESLVATAQRMRLAALEAVFRAGKGHIGGAFSIIEILVALYHAESLRHDPLRPGWADRDRFLLSKGHAAVALYAVLADRGYFENRHLEDMNRGGLLSEHPDPRIPGIEVVSGSLGHGLSVAAGIAFGGALSKRAAVTFALLGDGECNEGSVWEAAMFAAHHRLANLCAIIDRNGLITHGSTEEFNGLEPFSDKWRSFGWDVFEVDGHSIPELVSLFLRARSPLNGKPMVVIAETVKGKGVSFMEGNPRWHHGPIDSELYERAKQELQGSA
jgi:transketolase